MCFHPKASMELPKLVGLSDQWETRLKDLQELMWSSCWAPQERAISNFDPRLSCFMKRIVFYNQHEGHTEKWCQLGWTQKLFVTLPPEKLLRCPAQQGLLTPPSSAGVPKAMGFWKWNGDSNVLQQILKFQMEFLEAIGTWYISGRHWDQNAMLKYFCSLVLVWLTYVARVLARFRCTHFLGAMAARKGPQCAHPKQSWVGSTVVYQPPSSSVPARGNVYTLMSVQLYAQHICTMHAKN